MEGQQILTTIEKMRSPLLKMENQRYTIRPLYKLGSLKRDIDTFSVNELTKL